MTLHTRHTENLPRIMMCTTVVIGYSKIKTKQNKKQQQNKQNSQNLLAQDPEFSTTGRVAIALCDAYGCMVS